MSFCARWKKFWNGFFGPFWDLKCYNQCFSGPDHNLFGVRGCYMWVTVHKNEFPQKNVFRVKFSVQRFLDELVFGQIWWFSVPRLPWSWSGRSQIDHVWPLFVSFASFLEAFLDSIFRNSFSSRNVFKKQLIFNPDLGSKFGKFKNILKLYTCCKFCFDHR